MSTKQVFTTELLDGVPLEQCFEMELEHRTIIGDKIMELCLLEILRFKYMQTDPNWANFLYNPTRKQVHNIKKTSFYLTDILCFSYYC